MIIYLINKQKSKRVRIRESKRVREWVYRKMEQLSLREWDFNPRNIGRCIAYYVSLATIEYKSTAFLILVEMYQKMSKVCIIISWNRSMFHS